MKTIIRFFSSLKLAIVLLILLVAASILGTPFPKGGRRRLCRPPWPARRTDGQASIDRPFPLCLVLGIDGFAGLNIAVCMATRLGAKLRRAFWPKVESDPKSLAAGKISARLRIDRSAAEAKETAIRTPGLAVQGAHRRGAGDGEPIGNGRRRRGRQTSRRKNPDSFSRPQGTPVFSARISSTWVCSSSSPEAS